MFHRPLPLLGGLCAALALAPGATAQSSLFAVDRFGPLLRVIDPVTAATLDASRTLTLGGNPVTGAQGLARHPKTGVLHALVTDAGNVQSLVTVDEVTGACTIVSGTANGFYSDLAFSTAGDLYGVTGWVGSNMSGTPGAIHILFEGAGGFSTFPALSNVAPNQHAIGWNPENGKLLHATGGDNTVVGILEYRDYFTGAAEPALPAANSGPGYNQVSALFFAGSGKFHMVDTAGSLFEIDALTTNTTGQLPLGFLAEGLASGPNNACGNAIPITIGQHSGNLVGATNDGGAGCGTSGSSPDVWYRFHADNAGTLRVTTCGTNDLSGIDTGIDTVLSLHSACPGNVGNQLDCNDDAFNSTCVGLDAGAGRDSAVAAPMTAGMDVWIRVANFNNGSTGPFVLNVAYDRVNTSCANALPIGAGTTLGSLVGATQDDISSCDGAGSGTVDAWLSYTAPGDGTLNANTCGTNDLPGPAQGMDTILAAYSSCGVQLVCDDDGATCAMGNQVGLDSALSVPVQQGQTILFRVANFSGTNSTSSPGRFRFNLTFTKAGDTCADAAPLAPGNYIFNLAGTSSTPGFPCGNGDGDAWYELSAPADGRFEVDTCGTDSVYGSDTVLGLYDSCVNLASPLDCNDDALQGPCVGGFDSFISTQVTAGQTLKLIYTRIGGPGSNSDFYLNVRFTPTFEDFCNGDGGPAPGCTSCPCGNNAAPGTVGGCLNSNAGSARLLGSGTPAVGADTMRFDMTGGSPNTFAVLTSGPARAPSNATHPCFGFDSGVTSALLNGLRCVVSGGLGPVQRHGTRPTDSNGAVGLTTNGWGPPSGPVGGLIMSGGFIIGETRHFQVIYRDLPSGSCSASQNTTQGVTVTFQAP